jgi:hypothetical protein
VPSVTLQKNEYQRLKRQAEAYRKFAAQIFEVAIQDPVSSIVDDFRKTDIYSDTFLSDLESGLRKSSIAKKHGNTAT